MKTSLQVTTRRLTADDWRLAGTLFTLMADVFEEERAELGQSALERLLRREEFWALAAFVGSELAGGLTAHALPMTRSESSELFIYDIAVRPEFQRKGVGRALVRDVLAAAHATGIHDAFVSADNEDTHALDFYRALGGKPSPATMFSL